MSLKLISENFDNTEGGKSIIIIIIRTFLHLTFNPKISEKAKFEIYYEWLR